MAIPKSKGEWVLDGPLAAVGVDPGYASCAAVVVGREKAKAPMRALGFRLIQTKPLEKKLKGKLRVTDHDLSRYTEIWKGLNDLGTEHSVTTMGVEGYTPGRNVTTASTKVMAVYGGCIFWARDMNYFLSPFLPVDIKMRFVGKRAASKKEVEDAVVGEVDGLAEFLNQVPKTKREHVSDAAACAVLAIEEVDRVKHALGVS